MKIATLKKAFLPFGISFAVSLFWACSLNIEVEDPYPHAKTENPAPDSSAVLPPDLVEAPVDSPAIDTQFVDIIDTIDPVDTVIVDGPENPELAKDTVYLYDTLIVYKDTIYDTLYDTTSYTSFVSRKADGMLDTLTGFSSMLKCSVSDSSLTCEGESYIVQTPHCCFVKLDSGVTLYRIDTNTVHIHIVDTIYIDELRLTETVVVRDTMFLNYGDKRQTDYIPPQTVYKATMTPFDSTAMRALLDTLDYSIPTVNNIGVSVQSSLKFKGLPVVVREDLVIVDVLYPVSLFRKYPEEQVVRTNAYLLEPGPDVTEDTTVTWTLGYTHYEKGIEESDSIQVTTFIKVK